MAFDAYTVLRVLFNLSFLRHLSYYWKFLAGFPKKEVVAWELQVQSGAESKRIVFFVSPCKEYTSIWRQYSGCDCLFIPLAGRKNILLPYASVLTEALQPKAVIPVHHDDFFPPISYAVDFRNYVEWLKRSLPGTRLVELAPEQPTDLTV